MRIKIIAIDILDAQQQQRELNAFLASHSVHAMTRQFVQLGERAYWAFCIEYGEGDGAGGSPAADAADRKPKVDYKELLSPEEFEVFSRLREVRKEIAERADLPVYAVLTNAQLAEIVKNRVTTREGLSAVKGVGEARIAKFGDELLKCLRAATEGGKS